MLRQTSLQVIYEDNHLIAVNKPAGYLVHGDGSGDPVLADLVKSYIKIRYDKPGDVFLGVVHRLDRPVTGVVIFARTSKALERMNELLRDRAITKTYWALTDGMPPSEEGELVHWILKDHKTNKVRALDHKPKDPEAREARLSYTLMLSFNGVQMLEVHPETGRPHQIRAQLSRMGCAILGDKKYGSTRGLPDRSMGLHCHTMSFIHPVRKEPVEISCEPRKANGWDAFV